MASTELPKTIGRYEVRSLLGSGAMGRVLLAHDPVLDREVAIKLLRNDLAIGADVRDALLVRMRHEARAAARVKHPNLVVLHDMGEDGAVGLYLVFEYLEGPTLRQRIAERRLSPRSASKLARELGGALTCAHEKGVLHRDIKPDNIVLTEAGAKIADFGIARIPDSTLTGAGRVLGTPAYSAPETFHGGKFSPASDQFSLAATLYEAVSGARAFPGDDAVGVATKIMHEAPEPIARRLGYAPDLDSVLARGMAKAPEERFESCEELARALVAALSATGAEERARPAIEPAAAGPASITKPLAPAEERSPWRILLGGVGVVIVAALLVRAFLKNQEAPAATPPLSSASADHAPPAPTHAAPRPIRTPRSADEPHAAVPAPSAAQPAPPAPTVSSPAADPSAAPAAP